MPVKVEKLEGEAIIKAIVTEPFDPDRDMPAMFAELIPLRMAVQGKMAMIIDLSASVNNPNAFSQMVFTLARAADGIKAGKSTGQGGPPILIFVGSGTIADITARATGQAQYGGVSGQVCASMEEALALAHAKLSSSE